MHMGIITVASVASITLRYGICMRNNSLYIQGVNTKYGFEVSFILTPTYYKQNPP